LISLPKRWVAENGLRKGSQVGLLRLDNATLLVDPNPLERPRQRSIQVEMSDDIGRRLTAFYLSGYDRVMVKSKTTITSAQKDTIRAAASRLAGMEVINETSDSLLLVNLVIPVDLSVEDVMRRMHQIGNSMLVDATAALSRGDHGMAENVVARDDALDRLYFLVIRLLRSAVADMRRAEKMGVLPAQCLDLRFAASMMEKIGDDAVSMSSRLASSPTEALLPPAANDVAHEMARRYEQATRALLHGDFTLSNQVTRSRSSIGEMIEGLRHKFVGRASDDVLDTLEDVADHIFDIADVVTER